MTNHPTPESLIAKLKAEKCPEPTMTAYEMGFNLGVERAVDFVRQHESDTAAERDRLKATMKAIDLLSDMIDGGEECQGRDSRIREVIACLESDAWYIAARLMSKLKGSIVEPTRTSGGSHD